MSRRRPGPTLFPYTTLFRSGADLNARGVVRQWERKVITEPRPKDMNKGGFTPLLYAAREGCVECARHLIAAGADPRSEEHTSELQSRVDLVCRLLLEKKNMT